MRRRGAALAPLAAALAIALVLGSCARRDPQGEMAELEALARRYFEARFDFAPSWATAMGEHSRDRKLENFSSLRVQMEQVSLRAFLDTLASAIDSTALPAEGRVDYALLARDARRRLFEIEQLRIYERDPDLYHSTAAGAVHALLTREFAPLDERLDAVAAREEQIPAFLDSARQSLRDPPEIWTRIAIEQARGTVRFFEEVVPAAARGAANPAVRERVARANEVAIGAARDYLRFLETELLPRSRGAFALGRDLFMRRCAAEEWITEPPESILARALAEIQANHRQMAGVCRLIDSTATVEQVLARTTANHPAPAALLDSCRAEVARLRRFVQARSLVPLPSGDSLAVRETPLFARSLTFASMDAPGPLETRATEGVFYVTPVEASWSPARQEAYLAEFSRGLIYTTASHEVFPGHYVQGLYQRANPSLVRKLADSYAFSEGWAHYCEQMLLDEGYSDDPELRLYQLHDALLRLCRAVLTIRLHTQGWSPEQAVEWMVREGHQERVNAEREVRRYTMDPLVLSYWWGKRELLRLREEVRRQEGAGFQLARFHQRFLELGSLPMPLAAQEMLRVRGAGGSR